MHSYNLVSVTAKLVLEYPPGGHSSKLDINHSIVLSPIWIQWCSSYDEAELLVDKLINTTLHLGCSDHNNHDQVHVSLLDCLVTRQKWRSSNCSPSLSLEFRENFGDDVALPPLAEQIEESLVYTCVLMKWPTSQNRHLIVFVAPLPSKAPGLIWTCSTSVAISLNASGPKPPTSEIIKLKAKQSQVPDVILCNACW